MPHDYALLSSERVFDGAVISLRRDELAMPGDTTAKRDVVEHPGAVAILALDEQDRVVVVRITLLVAAVRKEGLVRIERLDLEEPVVLRGVTLDEIEACRECPRLRMIRLPVHGRAIDQFCRAIIVACVQRMPNGFHHLPVFSKPSAGYPVQAGNVPRFFQRQPGNKEFAKDRMDPKPRPCIIKSLNEQVLIGEPRE